MDKDIKYFIECLIPITKCNIKCHYCYVMQRHNRNMKYASFHYTPEYMAKALSPERLGGIAYISLCGAGETLMQEEIPEIVYHLLKEGHYVNITTNGTITKTFRVISELIPKEYLKRLNFSFSYHYLELKRINYIERFFENIKFVKSLGCSFVVQLNLCDEYINCIDEIKKTCIENVGALPQIAATRKETNLKNNITFYTDYNVNDYIKYGNEFNSPLFKFTMKNFMQKRKEFCFAGKLSYVFNFETGNISPCYCSHIKKNLYKELNSPIKFSSVGRHCKSPFCMNSSHFMALGVIPSINCPSYAELRNRKCIDGSEWYNDTMKEILSKKLYNKDIKTDYIGSELQYIKELYLGLKKKVKRIL